MNRSARTALVLFLAVALATASTYVVYRTIQSRPTREVEIAKAYAVVAARPLTLGTMLAADDVKLVPWPAANPVPGGFTKVEDAIGRGLVSPVAENEPLTGNNVAPKDSGAGLPPTIPPGMRAISVRVNDVIGVAGFVVPGTRVDVISILPEASNGSFSRVVVSDVQVLAAGTRYDQELAKEGKAVPSSVVTLLVTPEDAERVALASSEGQILLTLRNPVDGVATADTTIHAANLRSGDDGPSHAIDPPSTPRVVHHAAPAPVVVAAPPPVPMVEVIRAAKRSEEPLKP